MADEQNYAFEDAEALGRHWRDPELGFMQKLGGMFQTPEQRRRAVLTKALGLGSTASQGRLDDPEAGNLPPAAPPPIDRQALIQSLMGLKLDPDTGGMSVPPPGLGPEEPAPRGLFTRGFDRPAPSPMQTGVRQALTQAAGTGGGFGRPTADRLGMYSNTPLRPGDRGGRGAQAADTGGGGGRAPLGAQAADTGDGAGVTRTPRFGAAQTEDATGGGGGRPPAPGRVGGLPSAGVTPQRGLPANPYTSGNGAGPGPAPGRRGLQPDPDFTPRVNPGGFGGIQVPRSPGLQPNPDVKPGGVNPGGFGGFERGIGKVAGRAAVSPTPVGQALGARDALSGIPRDQLMRILQMIQSPPAPESVQRRPEYQ